MKTTFALLALLPLCSGFPAVPAAPAAAASRAAVTVSVPDFKTAVQPSIDELRKKVEARTATPADYKKVADEIQAAATAYGVDAPEAAAIKDRLLARIAELEAMARQKPYELLELDILKDQALDADLAFALARLKMRATSGQVEKADWDAIAKVLTARAASAKAWNPEIDAILGRLRTEIDALVTKAKAGLLKPTDFAAASDIVKEARVSNVVSRLEKRGLEKKALDADFEDVVDVAKHFPSADPDLVKKVQAKIEELKAAARAGKLTRDQFGALRDLLKVRARAAASPK